MADKINKPAVMPDVITEQPSIPSIVLQDLTAMVHHTSRFNGNKFDMVHVETILQTDFALPSNMQWYVPTGTTVPDYLVEMLQVSNVAMYPMSAEYVDREVSNIIEASKSRDLAEVTHDSSLLMLQAIMTPQSFSPVTGTTNLYHLAYDYKLFPNRTNPHAYDFRVVLPFHGLNMKLQSKIQMSIILPISAEVDAHGTQGIIEGGRAIQEVTQNISGCNRQIVSFSYQNDPELIVKYIYP